MKGSQRTPEQIERHYLIEKDLASRLRDAPREDRGFLYRGLYDQLFLQVPDHPQVTRKASAAEAARAVALQMSFLRRFLTEETVFLEVGPGDCALSFQVARTVKKVYAIDVSDEITRAASTPHNFDLILSDGSSIPLPSNSVDLAYSDQLMEHLHPDDAFEQLRNIHRVLAPGGIYICITPNRINGPHDVSRQFDEVATGFHLKEYDGGELQNLFHAAGFSQIDTYMGARGAYVKAPFLVLRSLETLLAALPGSMRRIAGQTTPIRFLLTLRFAGKKIG